MENSCTLKQSVDAEKIFWAESSRTLYKISSNICNTTLNLFLLLKISFLI